MESVLFPRKYKNYIPSNMTLIINGIIYHGLDRNNSIDTTIEGDEVTDDSAELQDNSVAFEFKKKKDVVEWIINGSNYSRSIEDERPIYSHPVEDISSKKRARHKFPKPDEWVQNRRKRLRQEGKSYVTRRGVLVPEKTFSIKQCTHCSAKCHEHFNKDELQEMFENFWKMDLQNKRQYLSQLVEETSVKRVRTKSARSRRSLTRHYYLIKNSSQRKKVCRGFFMEVFKVSSNFIRTVCKKRLKSGIVERDLRGKTSPPNKRPAVVRDFIRNHINRFRRSRSNGKLIEREYLHASVTLRSMYNAYVTDCENEGLQPEKYWLYADVFHKDFNLHFRKPTKCNDQVVKISSDKPSDELNYESSKILSPSEEAIVDEIVEPTVITVMADESQILCAEGEILDSSVDYKSLYEEEVRKNEQLQREIQNLTSLLKSSHETCTHHYLSDG